MAPNVQRFYSNTWSAPTGLVAGKVYSVVTKITNATGGEIATPRTFDVTQQLLMLALSSVVNTKLDTSLSQVNSNIQTTLSGQTTTIQGLLDTQTSNLKGSFGSSIFPLNLSIFFW